MTDQPTVAVALVFTSHYRFVTTGATEKEARDAMMAAWQRHCDHTRAERDFLDPDEDIIVLEAPIGSAFRDYSPI
ncbi:MULTISPECIES: hypothetical protein [Asanoa]|uniref:Uncharacterized protein n=2 Tax=Asanoa TaxID=195964 RepID=A0A239PFA8_9ACTN|nr:MULTISPECIES: hypothetical protein [Asanoa]GIF74167.1 hypothetical protein Asi02nite_36850 [Asanoa siamensis]SNT65683.1 hypothetical protein SAMN05421812_12526 [Asanoa hainanensis]